MQMPASWQFSATSAHSQQDRGPVARQHRHQEVVQEDWRQRDDMRKDWAQRYSMQKANALGGGLVCDVLQDLHWQLRQVLRPVLPQGRQGPQVRKGVWHRRSATVQCSLSGATGAA